MNTSGSTKAIDLVAVFDAAYEPEWERVAEQDDRTSSSGEADRMATLAGIRAVLACTAPEPAAGDPRIAVELSADGVRTVHLSKGGKDPNAKIYSARDVEVLIGIALAAAQPPTKGAVGSSRSGSPE